MVVIRKYGNRRLYDTSASRYVNLVDVADLVRAGEEVRVVDAKTDEDLTREVLLQVILDVHGGLDFLPVGLLRRVIRATGDEPQNRLLRQQLATAFDLLHGQLDRVESQFATMFPAFFRANAPAAPPPRAAAAAPPPPEDDDAPEEAPPPAKPASKPAAKPAAEASARTAGEPAAGPGDDLAALRARLEQLERRLKG